MPTRSATLPDNCGSSMLVCRAILFLVHPSTLRGPSVRRVNTGRPCGGLLACANRSRLASIHRPPRNTPGTIVQSAARPLRPVLTQEEAYIANSGSGPGVPFVWRYCAGVGSFSTSSATAASGSRRHKVSTRHLISAAAGLTNRTARCVDLVAINASASLARNVAGPSARPPPGRDLQPHLANPCMDAHPAALPPRDALTVREDLWRCPLNREQKNPRHDRISRPRRSDASWRNATISVHGQSGPLCASCSDVACRPYRPRLLSWVSAAGEACLKYIRLVYDPPSCSFMACNT